MTAVQDSSCDPQLSALLRTVLDAPPLRPGFHEELEARLAEAGVAGRGAHVTRVPARRSRLTVRRMAAATAVAAAAVFAFAVLPALRGADTATAADILAAMTAASGGAQSVRLHMILETGTSTPSESGAGDNTVETTDLTMAITGDSLSQTTSTSTWRDVDGVDHSLEWSRILSYDERRHEARSLVSASRERAGLVVYRPAWQPAAVAGGGYPDAYSALSATLRTALAETDPSLPVEETTYLGRPAWRGLLTVRERWGMDGEIPVAFRWDATVDQATGLLLAASCVMEVEGEPAPFTWDLEVTGLVVDPELKPDWRRPAGKGRKETIIDEGTRFGTPEEVATRSWPTLPLIPQWAPAGYRRTDVASAGFAPSGMDRFTWTPSDGSTRVVSRSNGVVVKRVEWPLPGQTVLVRFRRGFNSFVVQITPKTLGEHVSGTPDATLHGGYLDGQPATFTDGSGTSALGLQPPALLAYSDRSRVVISGDLTRDELVRVAESMKVYGDEAKSLLPGYGD